MNLTELQTISWWIIVVIYSIDFLVRLWLLVYIPRNRKPTAAMSWLLLIYILPVFGTIIFFILGSTKLSKHRRLQQVEINKIFKKYADSIKGTELAAEMKEQHSTHSILAESLTGLAPTANNAVSIISGYDEIIAEIIDKINSAKSHVYVEFYVTALDTTTEPFFKALEAAIERGVAVYVLFDAWGSKKFPRYKEMMKRLTDMGVKWSKILPISLNPSKYNRIDLRNHRKIVVIDSKHAYIGSLNMIDKTYHRKDAISYIELMIHLEGPSVNESAAVFASDWYLETSEFLTHYITVPDHVPNGKTAVQLIPSGPSYKYQNNLRFFNSLVHSAQKSIVISNPYLVPDESLLGALTSAAKRGIDVSVLNSEAMDQWMVGHAQRSYYEELLDAGVKIYLYKKPQLIHEKFMSVDDEVGVVGSSNMDIRSFELNFECIVAIYDKKIAKQLSDHHRQFLNNSKQIKLSQWRKRSVWQNLLDGISRLTSALQ